MGASQYHKQDKQGDGLMASLQFVYTWHCNLLASKYFMAQTPLDTHFTLHKTQRHNNDNSESEIYVWIERKVEAHQLSRNQSEIAISLQLT
jgi:hypothetical protein